ncbi:MAG: hypothetical protein H7259_01510, partial [Cytophagales bacterium]|nr:hypothetical protein [Cytophaga sp.]
MNISIVIPSFYPATIFGGTIYSSLYTAEELGKLGCTVRVSTTDTNRDTYLDVPLNTFQEIAPNVS